MIDAILLRPTPPLVNQNRGCLISPSLSSSPSLSAYVCVLENEKIPASSRLFSHESARRLNDMRLHRRAIAGYTSDVRTAVHCLCAAASKSGERRPPAPHDLMCRPLAHVQAFCRLTTRLKGREPSRSANRERGGLALMSGATSTSAGPKKLPTEGAANGN